MAGRKGFKPLVICSTGRGLRSLNERPKLVAQRWVEHLSLAYEANNLPLIYRAKLTKSGAGCGNQTRVLCLEGRNSIIELIPLLETPQGIAPRSKALQAIALLTRPRNLIILVDRGGFAPPTLPLKGGCSSSWSYRSVFVWLLRWESNPQHPP